MKKTKFLGLSLVSILALTACGGGGGTSSPETGTAKYIDSAVAGVNYKCGTQEGITSADGSFTFDIGEGCTFYLGDIKLRDIDKSLLKDGEEVIEKDVKVAQLLQSLDFDGNPENGITIKKEVVEAMATSLSENGGDGTLPDTVEELEVVVAALEHVDGYTGQAVTSQQATEHLTRTQTEITKELLAGKTFYVVGEDGDDKNKVDIFKIIVNNEATSFKSYKLDGTLSGNENIKISGNKMTFTNDTDGSYSLISQENAYVFADDRNANGSKDGTIGHRLYASQSDAQAYYDSIKTETPFKLSDLIGKTLYQHVKEKSTGNITISEMTVQSDGKIKIVDFGNTVFLAYRIQGDTLYTTEVNGQEKAHPLLEKTDKYVKFSDGGSYTSTFYFSKADAEATPVKEIGNS